MIGLLNAPDGALSTMRVATLATVLTVCADALMPALVPGYERLGVAEMAVILGAGVGGKTLQHRQEMAGLHAKSSP